ncbi:protein rolling stone [Aplysia californica]|uniref:Protein rolling stone n=1 Tax=Aplysia californica TaxID=6500 RepID=A0ABM1A1E5_APLCA|nr:protein rolling stone [Aplysia californica]
MEEDSIRAEFQCNRLGLNHPNPDKFVKSQWPLPRIIYVIWRGFWCVWHLVWIVISGVHTRENKTRYPEEGAKWFIYIGNIVFLLTTLTCTLDFVFVLYATMRTKGSADESSNDAEISIESSQAGNSKTEEILFQGEFTVEGDWTNDPEPTPWHLKLVWALYNVVNCVNVLTTIMHWAVERQGTADAVEVTVHALNSLFVIANLLVTALPVQILHFVYPAIFVVLYFLLNLVYFLADGTDMRGNDVIYKAVDWNSAFPTTLTIALGILVAVPLGHLLMFSIYTFRLFLYSLSTRGSYSTSGKGKHTTRGDPTVPKPSSSAYVTGVE